LITNRISARPATTVLRRGGRRWLALGVAGAAATGWLLAGSAAPAGAADRGANGEIAFSQGNGQIVVYSGGAEQVLTPSGASQTQPAFSPDGTRIAYASSLHIWIMKANGTGAAAVPVTGNPYEGDPTWSPDATKLGYINGSNGQIYTVKTAGGTPTQLTTSGTSINDLKWSPRGSAIAYDAYDSGTGNTQVFTVSMPGGVVKRLTGGSCGSAQPDWSPDGTRIAFETDCIDGAGNIATMPAGGGAATQVALYSEADAGYPSWSPDGSVIVFSANEGTGSEQLWEASPGTPGDGTHVSAVQLTHDPGQPANTAPSWQPVHHAKVTATPKTAAPGAQVTVTATDFLSGQVVKLTFTDAKGVKTALGSVTTTIAGGKSSTVKLPVRAAPGAGKLTATGTGGLSATTAVTVT
jgi:dipeptidyl aminopeptidase/acylaminoacyl peptidase